MEENLKRSTEPGAPRVWLKAVAGYLLAFACLAWALRKFELHQLLKHLSEMNPSLVVAGVLCSAVSYVFQGARWQLLLSPLSPVRIRDTTEAIYAGLFVNEVVPLRLGEVVRAVLISRRTSLKYSSILASILVERMWDGLWLAAGVSLLVHLTPLPRRLIEAADTFTVLILVALILFGLVVFGSRAHWSKYFASGDLNRSPSLFKRLAQSVITFVRQTSSELNVISRARSAILAGIVSLGFLFLEALSFWLIILAYGLRLSLLESLAVFLIMHLGTVVPAAPANVGTYQFFTVLGLTIFGVDRATAAGFSLVVFGLLTIPIGIIGFWAFGRTGMTLSEVVSGGTTSPGTRNLPKVLRQ